MNARITQAQRLARLVEVFKADSGQYAKVKTPEDDEGRKRLLRSLMNIRQPGDMPAEVLQLQDEYLKGRAKEKGIVTLKDIPLREEGLSLWQGDITRLAVDAIVNAANSQMLRRALLKMGRAGFKCRRMDGFPCVFRRNLYRFARMMAALLP